MLKQVQRIVLFCFVATLVVGIPALVAGGPKDPPRSEPQMGEARRTGKRSPSEAR